MSRASWSDDTGRGGGSARALLRNGSSCPNCHDLQSVCESLNQLLQEKERQVKLLERDLEVQKSLNNKLLENVCEQQKQGAGSNGFVPPNLLRDCPVCHMSFPPHNSEIERAHHVNNHFLDN
ncbi:unnamed protein product [Lampetra fluviatilis]